MVTVTAGEFTFGEGDTIKNIDYDYEIMKYTVTDYEYVLYMLDAMENGNISVNENGASGNYPGDAIYPNGDYTFISFISSKILWSRRLVYTSKKTCI